MRLEVFLPEERLKKTVKEKEKYQDAQKRMSKCARNQILENKIDRQSYFVRLVMKALCRKICDVQESQSTMQRLTNKIKQELKVKLIDGHQFLFSQYAFTYANILILPPIFQPSQQKSSFSLLFPTHPIDFVPSNFSKAAQIYSINHKIIHNKRKRSPPLKSPISTDFHSYSSIQSNFPSIDSFIRLLSALPFCSLQKFRYFSP